MRANLLKCTFAALMCLCAGGASNAQTYSVTAIASNSFAQGINQQGQVVGFIARSNAWRAFQFYHGALTEIGTLGGVNSFAYGINRDGQIIGDSDTFAGLNRHAFLWNVNTGIADLGKLPNATNSQACAVNSQGQVVGFGFTTNGARAFLYSGGAMQDLGSFGGNYQYALGINDSSQIVGWMESDSGYMRGFIYEHGSVTPIGSINGNNSYAYAINNAGIVVGDADTAEGYSHAFLYGGGNLVDLGTLGGFNSFAFSINLSNQVVGASSVADGNVMHAFLWQNGEMRDLNALIPPTAGWELREARALNDAGQIVGWGMLNGQVHGFLLTPSSNATNPPAGLPPAVNLISPANNQVFLVGTNVVISAAASDSDGTVAFVEFFVDGNKVGSSGANPYSMVWSNLPSGFHTIAAKATDNQGITALSAPIVVQIISQGFRASINFQIAGTPVPPGYVADVGAVYGNRGGNLTFGWNIDNAVNARDRNAANSADQRYDTLTHMQRPGSASVWEMAVPNGVYTVHVVAGDPSNFDSVYRIAVEGIVTVDGRPDTNQRWIEGVRTVEVTDGRLTVSNADGSTNNKICFLDVTPGLSAKVNFQAVGSATPAGYFPDAGNAFGDRGNGYVYGWNADNTAFGRDRNAANSLDQRYDTFIHMQRPGSATVWEMAVPNDIYRVHLVAGDPSYDDSVYKLAVEDELIVNGTPNSSNRWQEGYATVWVGDGKLTVSSAAGADNNKICFIDIASEQLSNEKPTLAIQSPVNGAVYLAPAQLALVAQASDQDGTVRKMEIFCGSEKLCESTNEVISLLLSNLVAGSYTFTARATDNLGATNTSASVRITVIAPTSAPVGSGDGLWAFYFENPDFTTPKLSRVDGAVDFNWSLGSPAGDMAPDMFSVRWFGFIQPQFTETYTFTARTDDGVRLWVNHVLVIDRWLDQGATDSSGSIALAAGQKYEIKLEYYENSGNAMAQLWWSSPSTPKCIIPRSQLYSQTGNGDGLLGSYYSFDATNLACPPVVRVDQVVDFNWGYNAPQTGVSNDNFSVRWTGAILVPLTETYTFYVQSDDGVRLWVNEQLLIDQWQDQGLTETSGKIKLLGGQFYTIKLEYYDHLRSATVKLLWSSPTIPKTIVPQSQLCSVALDSDHDGMLDQWELRFGLNPHDASDAAADNDGDGLSNLEESRAATNPLMADTDGDGLNDCWETQNHLDPLNADDAVADADADGLSNLDEYSAGSNPNCADSDGDGLPDWMELNETHTDPNVSDISAIVNVAEVAGSTAVNRLGRWELDGDGIFSLDRRGSLDYSVSVPNADAYRIEIEGRERLSAFQAQAPLSLIVYLDGEYLERISLANGTSSNSVTHCFTPWIKAGAHSIRIFWDNAVNHRSLQLAAVRLQALVGADQNANGVKDWVENRLRSHSGVELRGADATAPVVFSAVSPVCLEGRGRYLGMMKFRGDLAPLTGHGHRWFADMPTNLSAMVHFESTDILPQPGAGHRWIANVPLSPSHLTVVETSHQNDGLRETNRFIWDPLNLLEAGNLLLRSGDSLLLAAAPPGERNGKLNSGLMRIEIVGVTNYEGKINCPFPHCFDAPGDYQVTGIYVPKKGAPQSRTILVKVVIAAFNGHPAAMINRSRTWDCPQLPPEVVVESDPRLKFTQVQLLPQGGRQFSVTTDETVPRYVIARLGTNGPVLANAAIEGFQFYSSSQVYVQVTEKMEDGAKIVDMGMVLSPVRPDLSVRMNIFVGGVIFEDGTVSKELISTDFNALGEASVRFYKPPGTPTSVCHHTKIYQGAVYLGGY